MAINGVIQRKFALLDKHWIEITQRLEQVSLEQFKNDWGLRLMTERSLQVMVEIIIDVAERIVATLRAGPAATASEAIEKLVHFEIIRSATPYLPLVRFRNLIVHRYEEIDPQIVYDIVQNHLELFRRFRDEVDTYGEV